MNARARDRRVYLGSHPVLFALLALTRRRPVLRLGRTVLVHDREAYVAALTRVPLDRSAEGTTGGAAGRLTGSDILFDQSGAAHRRTRRATAEALGSAGVARLRPLWLEVLDRRLSPLRTGGEVDLVDVATEMSGVTAAALLDLDVDGRALAEAALAAGSTAARAHLPGLFRRRAHRAAAAAAADLTRLLTPPPPDGCPRSAEDTEPGGPQSGAGTASVPRSGPGAAGGQQFGAGTTSGPGSGAGAAGCPRSGAGAPGGPRSGPGATSRPGSGAGAGGGSVASGLATMLAVAAINTSVAGLPRAAAWCADAGLWDWAVSHPQALADELLRVTAPTPLLPRVAAASADLPMPPDAHGRCPVSAADRPPPDGRAGFAVRRGDRLMLVARHAVAAHRGDPDPAAPAPAHVAQLVFGTGPHACPGARLARTQLADLLVALAPSRPEVVRAEVDRRAALPGWSRLIVRATT